MHLSRTRLRYAGCAIAVAIAASTRVLAADATGEVPRTTFMGRFVFDRVPDFLLGIGPGGLTWVQWLLLPLVLVVSYPLGKIISAICRWLLRTFSKRTKFTWDDQFSERIGAPLTLGLTFAVAMALSSLIELPSGAQKIVVAFLRAGVLAALFWGASRAVDVAMTQLLASPWSAARPSSRALIPIGARIARVAIVCLGVVALVSSFGYPVASLIAGLGVGGLAVALAAQKTFENLFGAFSLGLDQPFREGDFIKMDDFVGTVEHVGLRSTRIRTLDRTLITIPNGQVADKRIESFAARDRIRLFVTIGVVYGTTSTQMKTILEGLVAVLRNHPKIWPDAVISRFVSFGPSSLDIEVMAWFNTVDFDEFCAIRSEVLVAFMRVVEDAGSSFAFPTTTVHFGDGAERLASAFENGKRETPAPV